MKYREEKDTMGTMNVPFDSYYGPQTQRAVENFPVSGLTFPLEFVHTLARIKKYAAHVNHDLGVIDKTISDAVIQATDEILTGRFNNQFVVDIFQTGSGTSTNMNMNEVVSMRANEILTGKRNGKNPVHPNDHVNHGQSSNDVIPTVIHITSVQMIKQNLLPSLKKLMTSLDEKSNEFKHIKKIGRTHLQDAVPMTLGDEFSGYARQIYLGIRRIESVLGRLSELALGGTAIGSGINTHPDFAKKVISHMSHELGIEFKEAENHYEAQASQDSIVETSGALKTVAVSLVKIANDVRWLSSGPRCGFGEITIPSLQPGSSIMPGKVNPVIPESVLQVAAQIMGNDMTITQGAQSGNFELNVMLPVMAYNLIQSISILSTACRLFSEKCISGITANEDTCLAYIEKSLALVTGLIPFIGYDKAAEIAKKAYRENKTVKQVVTEDKILNDKQIQDVFS